MNILISKSSYRFPTWISRTKVDILLSLRKEKTFLWGRGGQIILAGVRCRRLSPLLAHTSHATHHKNQNKRNAPPFPSFFSSSLAIEDQWQCHSKAGDSTIPTLWLWPTKLPLVPRAIIKLSWERAIPHPHPSPSPSRRPRQTPARQRQSIH